MAKDARRKFLADLKRQDGAPLPNARLV